jgi:hypothetical protein
MNRTDETFTRAYTMVLNFRIVVSMSAKKGLKKGLET